MAKRQNFVVGSINPNTNTWTSSELNNGWDKYQVLYSGDLDGVFKAVSDYSNDSSQEIANAIQALTGAQPTGASQNELAGALQQMQENIETSSLTFKGYVATSAPSASTYGLVKGNIWINASEMPTTFPVAASSIRVWNGTSWATTTETYTAKDFDFFRNINDNEGYYWFGGQWTVMSTDMSTTYFTLNQSTGKWEIKSSVSLPGSPTTTTPAAGDNSTKIATTNFVANSFAPLASPELTGTPTAPTPTSDSTDNQIATKKYVDEAIAPLPTNTYFPDLFDVKWTDHELDDMAWLRGDTFSWQDGAVYENAYNHLYNEYNDLPTGGMYRTFTLSDVNYFRFPAADHTGDTYQYAYASIYSPTVAIVYASSTSVSTSSTIYNGSTSSATSLGNPSSVASARYIMPIIETIDGINISYYLAADGHKICLASQESNVSAIYTLKGVAWYYILDTVNQRFKLPRTQYAFTGLRDTVGKYVAAGLPNITATGQIGTRYDQGTPTISGAFVNLRQGGRGSDEPNTTGWLYDLDASKSNVIYGNSTAVQPRATQMYLYFYVGEFTQTALENTAGLNAELFNNKADLNLLNTANNVDFVIESQLPTAQNNYTWYRKYKSGWVEQGGYSNVQASTSETITLPIEMADTNYWLMCGLKRTTNAGSGHSSVGGYINSTTQITLLGDYNDSGASSMSGAYWEVKGSAQ